MINSSKKETSLESIDHLLSIIDIKTIAQQVKQLQILKEYANTNKGMSLRDKLTIY